MSGESARRSLTGQSLAFLAGRLVGFVFAFFVPIALVRLLTQTDFGTYKQFFLVSGFLVSTIPLGLHASLFYFIPRDPRRAGNYFSQTAALTALLGGAAGTLLVVGRRQLAAALNSPGLEALAWLLALVVALGLVGRLLDRTVVIEAQAGFGAAVFVLTDMLKAVGLLVPALLTHDLWWVCVGAVLIALVRASAAAGWSWHRFRDRFEAGRGPLHLGEQVRYALTFGGAAITQNAVFYLPGFFVSARFDPSIFAVYAVGAQPIAPVQLFFASLFEVALVEMTRRHGAGDREGMRALWRTLLLRQAIVLVPLVALLSLIAVPLVSLMFTPAYLDAVPILRLHLLLILVTMVNDHAVLRAVADTRTMLRASLTGLGVAAVAVPTLTWTIGPVGAAVGLLLGAGATKAIGLRRVATILDTSAMGALPWRGFARYAAAAGVGAALALPVLGTDLPEWAVILLGSGLFATGYAGAGWLRFFTQEDRSSLWALARPVLTRVAMLRSPRNLR